MIEKIQKCNTLSVKAQSIKPAYFAALFVIATSPLTQAMEVVEHTQLSESWTSPHSPKASRYLSGDFDGDNNDDLVEISYDYDASAASVESAFASVWLNADQHFVKEQSRSWVGVWSDRDKEDARSYLVLDADGDGIDDIIEIWKEVNTANIYGDAKASLWRRNGNDFSLVSISWVGGWSDATGDHARKYLAGDVNNDGLDDVIEIFPGDDVTHTTVWESTGTGFKLGSVSTLQQSWHDTNQLDSRRYMTADVNQDGKVDILSIEKNPDQTNPNALDETLVYTFLNQGDQTFADTGTPKGIGYWADIGSENERSYIAANIAGNGLTDIAELGPDFVTLWQDKGKSWVQLLHRKIGAWLPSNGEDAKQRIAINTASGGTDIVEIYRENTKTMAGYWRSSLAPLQACPFNEPLNEDVIAAKQVFMSLSGDDGNVGTKALPVATLEGARCLVRRLRHHGVTGTLSVNIAPGDYTLNETFVLGLEDGGSGNDHTLYQAADSTQPPLFHSDVTISGWQLAQGIANLSEAATGKVYQADIPQALAQQRIYSLFDDGERRDISQHDFYSQTDIYQEGDFRAPSYKQHLFVDNALMAALVTEQQQNRLDDLEISIYPRQKWMWYRMKIKDIRADENYQANVKYMFQGPWYDGLATGTNPVLMDRYGEWGLTKSPLHRYGTEQLDNKGASLYNALVYLDQPGEWAVDSQAGKIYYWPKDKQLPTNITAPKLSEYIKVEGVIDTWNHNDIPVQNLHFKNLRLTRGERSYQSPSDGTNHSEWAIYDKDNALLRFRGAEHSSVDQFEIFNTGGNGIRLDLYSQHISVVNSHIHDIGKTGVVVLGNGAGTKDVNKNNLIANNEISYTGQRHRLGQGIILSQTNNSQAKYNKIHHISFNGISVVGSMRPWRGAVSPLVTKLGEEANPVEDITPEYKAVRFHEIGAGYRSLFNDNGTGVHLAADVRQNGKLPNYEQRYFGHTHENEIAYNDLSQTMTHVGDSNAIYVNTTSSANNSMTDPSGIKVHHNYIHNIETDHGQTSTALRSDEEDNGTEFSDNIIFIQTPKEKPYAFEGAIDFRQPTTLHNNYIISQVPNAYTFKLHQADSEGNYSNNLVYTNSNYQILPAYKHAANVPVLANADLFNANLYFSTDEYYQDVLSPQDFLELTPLNYTAFHPEKSDNFADPKFVVGSDGTSVFEKSANGFLLQADSPALTMGIKQLNVMEMGLRSPYVLDEQFQISNP